jgi:PilZ domain-containing protein
MNEKRSHQRYALWFPVTVDTHARKVWAVCRDASAGGILVTGSAELKVGEVVTLSFRVSADGQERKVSGRIVRVEAPDDDPRAVWPYKVAIEFLEPDATLQSNFARASSRPPAPVA